MKKLRNQTLRHADMILFLAIAALAAIAFSVLCFFHTEGEYASVYVDGREVGRYPLSENREVTVPADGGYNVIVIRDGKADVTDADCPDGTCVHSRAVSGVGETIVCLPHKLTVRIVGKEAPDADIRLK